MILAHPKLEEKKSGENHKQWTNSRPYSPSLIADSCEFILLERTGTLMAFFGFDFFPSLWVGIAVHDM